MLSFPCAQSHLPTKRRPSFRCHHYVRFFTDLDVQVAALKPGAVVMGYPVSDWIRIQTVRVLPKSSSAPCAVSLPGVWHKPVGPSTRCTQACASMCKLLFMVLSFWSHSSRDAPMHFVTICLMVLAVCRLTPNFFPFRTVNAWAVAVVHRKRPGAEPKVHAFFFFFPASCRPSPSDFKQ